MKNSFLSLSVVYKLMFLCTCIVSCAPQSTTLTILHTNDSHSQVEPLDAQSNNGDLSGYVRRLGLIERYRKTDEILLVDAGDFWQGTPYFNIYNGAIEIEAMNRMRYDAATLGNHEFDNGVDSLVARLKDAQFQIVCANYDVTNSELRHYIKPYTIVYKKGVKIGIIGVGVNPDGLIQKENFAGIVYNPPIEAANKVAYFLKHKEKCEVVVCLSHLGYEYSNDIPSDVLLAKNSTDIDLIIGGHSHSMITNTKFANLKGDSVQISQMGKSAAFVGCIQLELK